ncbi:MAG: hypothetical protein Q7S12_00800 [bacterium]|nr:hypothetical protein [bacterium]
MNVKNVLKEVLKIGVLGGVLIAVQSFAFTEPTQVPPGGNVSAPINISNTGQSKAGGLILNTAGAVLGLIVDKGDVGIGTVSPAQKLDVVGGQIHATGDICTDAGGGKCLSTVGGGGDFAGMFWIKSGSCAATFVESGPVGSYSCLKSNFYTGACSCPAGFSAHVVTTMCGGWPGNTAIYYCSNP